jgi:hypothetical protein
MLNSRLLLAVAFAMACGPTNELRESAASSSKSEHDSDEARFLDELRELFVDKCTNYNCGTNSPVLNSFPINGLHRGGHKNADGQTLPLTVDLDASANGGLCPAAALTKLHLDFDVAQDRVADGYKMVGYELVAMDRRGAVQCRGNALAGMKFEIRKERHYSWVTEITNSDDVYTLVISEIGRIQTERITTDINGTPHRERLEHYGYLIGTAADPKTSLCESKQLKRNAFTQIEGTVSDLSETRRDDREPVIPADEEGDFAVVIRGMLLDREHFQDHVLSSENAADWFNIACAFDALGQTELSGLVKSFDDDPRARTNRYEWVNEWRTVLNMFAARYTPDLNATVAGTPIMWIDCRTTAKDLPLQYSFSAELLENEDLGASGNLAPARVQNAIKDVGGICGGTLPDNETHFEAEWSEDGASCLEHSRLWIRDTIVPWIYKEQGYPPKRWYPLGKYILEREFLAEIYLRNWQLNSECQAPVLLKPSSHHVLVSLVRYHIDDDDPGHE